jgi:hypothetical protein
MFVVVFWRAGLTQPPVQPYPWLSSPELHSMVPPANTLPPPATV